MRTLTFLLACATAASAQEQPQNLIKNAGFEAPAISARTAVSDGGHPRLAEEGTTSWTHFHAPLLPNDKPGGNIVVGITNQFARTGKQSIFVDFQQVGPVRRSLLMTDLLPVKSGHLYRVALWGRIDPKRPLTLDQRRPMMKLEFEYFKADPEEQCEHIDHGTQMIPGRLDRLMFLSTKWTEYFRVVRTPEDAAFMKVTFRWETERAPGTTDGIIYFDDASIIAVPGGESLAPLDPTTLPPAPPAAEKDDK